MLLTHFFMSNATRISSVLIKYYTYNHSTFKIHFYDKELLSFLESLSFSLIQI